MDILNHYQEKLFPYAYNILGSSDDAKDAVQEVMTRYITAPKQQIGNETGYLIKSVINQSVNIKKRNQRNSGNSTWLPEPVATERADDNILRNEIISYSMLVLLEYLNPRERAVFILKEAFDYSHEEIAEILNLSVENSRKLLSRAKAGLKNADKNFTSPPPDSSFLDNYIRVIKNGDTRALEAMLSQEIAVKTDGGGKVSVVSELTVGIQASASLILYVYETYLKRLTIRVSEINHQPALLFYSGNTLISCQVFEVNNDHRIRHIFSVVDPDKLKNLLF